MVGERQSLGATYFCEGARRAQSHVNALIDANYNLNNVQVELSGLYKKALTHWNTPIEHFPRCPWNFICFGFALLVHRCFLDFVEEIR